MKDKSAVAEELTEHGGGIGKDLPSRHVYFSDSDGSEEIREKSKDGKRKRKKDTDCVERTVNVRDRYSLGIDSNSVVKAVEVVGERRNDENKNRKEKRKRGDDVEKLSYRKKKSAKGDARIREESSHVIGEDVKEKVANYEEPRQDSKDHTVIVSSEKDRVKGIKVSNNKDRGNNKRNKNERSMENEEDMEEMKKVSNDMEVRKDKEQTSGEVKKRVEHVKERKNGKRTESCLTQTVAGETSNGPKKIQHTKGTRDDGCITLNLSKDVVGVELEKNRKKKSKIVRKERAQAAKSISKEISDKASDIDGRKKDKEPANIGDLNTSKQKVNADHLTNSSPNKKSKSVSFSGKVEVFPFSNDIEHEEDSGEDNLVQGKRFSEKEDALIKESVENYIMAHGLEEKGLDMILHCRSHPEVKGCWKEIGAALPWRPRYAVYYRAHILYERSDTRKWLPSDYDILRRHHEKHGSNWKDLAGVMGRHRFHVKDAWRRIKLPNLKRGTWTQDEYQTLFDLVNMDLRMKAFEEKKTKHGMLRDNISWEAISWKLSTRSHPNCCVKWYEQLASPMVAEGKWDNTDDYRLLSALIKVDASNVDDVDWDNLVDNRPEEVCRKRWNQMCRHIGENREKSFAEQVELLCSRYIPNLVEVVSASESEKD